MVVAEDGRLARYMREVISPPVDVEEARVDIGILDCATVLKLRPHHHLACHAPLDTPALIFVGDREGLQLTGESRHHEILGLGRSEEHTSELQSLMRISYAVFCLKKKKTRNQNKHNKELTQTMLS